MVAASNLGRHRIDLTALYNITRSAPEAALRYTYLPGATRVIASVTHDPDETQLELNLSRPLWHRTTPANITTLTLGVESRYRYFDAIRSARLEFETSGALFHRRRSTVNALYGSGGIRLTSALRLHSTTPRRRPPGDLHAE